MGRAAALLLIFLLRHLRSEGAEEGAAVKKARAQPGGEELRPPAAEDGGQQAATGLPLSFLSPSVLQALELGKAIPAWIDRKKGAFSLKPEEILDLFCAEELTMRRIAL
ncbi:Hypothetical predicted protein [Cloeon dipterum]|uniref:Uncharacterized protein n=1 Tax=Cloeon dipterum TaxID=197152 RepID=A0A8S1BXS4_9INSE|nr:Hypothetical predicted protein [Cloeon dipterum]